MKRICPVCHEDVDTCYTPPYVGENISRHYPLGSRIGIKYPVACTGSGLLLSRSREACQVCGRDVFTYRDMGVTRIVWHHIPSCGPKSSGPCPNSNEPVQEEE